MSYPYYAAQDVTLYAGDALEVLADMPDASVDCVVTSPPYWGLRDYGTGRWVGGDPRCAHSVGRGSNIPQSKQPGVAYPASAGHRGGDPARCRRCGAVREDRQYGLEPTPQDYVDTLRAVFTQVRRVLVDTGTIWLNLGDSYSAQPPGRTADPMRTSTLSGTSTARVLRDSVRAAGVDRSGAMAQKNLLGMPWRVALALQADGLILRNGIVWHKPNAMPESVRDRLSARHETLFLFVKQQRYFFDLDAIREPLSRPEALGEGIVIGGAKGRHAGIGATARRRGHTIYSKYTAHPAFARRAPGESTRPTGQRHSAAHPRGKNPGDVWSIPTRPLRAAHYAPFPIDIPLRCVAAGCPPGGVVLDPFSGAATTGVAAHQLGRAFIGIDLNPAFHDLGISRLPADPDQSKGAGDDPR
jgi:site-specific DNA-methyltransferase (cytosine-N4-specific)